MLAGNYLAGELDNEMFISGVSSSSLGFMDLLGFQYFPTNTTTTSSFALESHHLHQEPLNQDLYSGLNDISYQHPTTTNYSSSSTGEPTSETTYQDQHTSPVEHLPQKISTTTKQGLKAKKSSCDNEMKKGVGQKRKRKEANSSRVAFMTKSEVDHLEDGFRWRKYGQKAVKNSTFPRSYYRCTSATCNVKKRVERLFSDPTVVVTTYEGKHVHPSPVLMHHRHSPVPTTMPSPFMTSTTFTTSPQISFPHDNHHQYYSYYSNLQAPLNRDGKSNNMHISTHYRGLLQDIVPSMPKSG